MATATVPTTTGDADEIRRRMAQIRQHLRQDAKAVVAGAEAVSDWKHYVKLYPWAAVGIAFAAGYLIVPRKRRSVTQTAEKAAEAAIAKVVESVDKGQAQPAFKAAKPEAKPESKKGWIGTILGLAAPMVWRAAQSYVMNYAETFLAQHAQSQAQFQAPQPPGAQQPKR